MALLKNISIEVRYINERVLSDEQFASAFPEIEPIRTNILQVDRAYHRVNKISGDKTQLKVEVQVFKDSNVNCLLHTEYYTFEPDVSNETTANYHVQAYSYLKTLNSYADAIDC